jgi:alkylation response protein AidB-like acyl-CoA dehydrogenase
MLALTHAIPAAARTTCESAIQVHGGTGFTWEYGLHLFYRRVLAIEAELGGASASARGAGRQYLESIAGRAGV